jgi:hypothetical protein
VDGTAWNCPSSPVLKIILAACTANDGLQRIFLKSSAGFLPAHICCLSSVQFRHSRSMCCTVWHPRLHWHLSVSALSMVWRYARKPILPVRICVMTEPIALCAPRCILRALLPVFTLSLYSCLPCFATSHDVPVNPMVEWLPTGSNVDTGNRMCHAADLRASETGRNRLIGLH